MLLCLLFPSNLRCGHVLLFSGAIVVDEFGVEEVEVEDHDGEADDELEDGPGDHIVRIDVVGLEVLVHRVGLLQLQEGLDEGVVDSGEGCAA